jgi:hypothetical protein
VRGSPKFPATRCRKPHGIDDPLTLVIACKCGGCEGELHSDGIRATATRGFLICTTCGCVYTIGAVEEIRR